jgi:hypothetical protein
VSEEGRLLWQESWHQRWRVEKLDRIGDNRSEACWAF